MLKTIQGMTDEQGNVRIVGDLKPPPNRSVLIVYDGDEDEEFIKGVPVTALLAEQALQEYWDRPEEDEAWKDFQSKAK